MSRVGARHSRFALTKPAGFGIVFAAAGPAFRAILSALRTFLWERMISVQRRDKINYYLDLAEVVAQRGTCLRRLYGAVIVKTTR